ncbi:hypothetical protein OEZ85_003725 [Tetradesmus obliquus]|uniref:FAD-binding domain-containing protein n=1 Tax=Tetradesmus obliquus TaxID=3088 RepID=A0ABY8UD23_TETOB|nr:hypothetical protein OEZ85_003725 [Tetradesmus obliquus]
MVFEAAHAIKEVGAGISLAPNGMRVLDSLGLAQKVAADVGEPIHTMHASRPDERTIVEFPTMAMERFGLPMIGVRRFRLLNVLLEAMQAADIPLQLGKRLHEIHQPPGSSSSDNSSSSSSSSSSTGPATLVFEDGSSSEADLVVGCDGLRSRTRAIVKGGAEPPPKYTGEEIVFAVTMDRNHDLVPPNTCRMVYGPGHKHFGTYGLGSDCSWFTSTARSSSSDSWGPVADAAAIEAVKSELADKFKGWGLVQRMLEREVAVMIRVGVFDRDPTPTWSSGVITLLGDAASPIPPNLGQGGNKALEDAGVLAACLARHQSNIHAALKQYESLRSKRAAALLRHSRSASSVANLQNPLAAAARDVLLRGIVATKGTIPSDWMWQYDCETAVAQG